MIWAVIDWLRRPLGYATRTERRKAQEFIAQHGEAAEELLRVRRVSASSDEKQRLSRLLSCVELERRRM